jgi:multiple sugar transport system permease protein
LRNLGFSPDTIFTESNPREEFLARFFNTAFISSCASGLAVILGSFAAYGLSRFNYKFGFMRNPDISFFFLSQLILPPVVLALPVLVLYRELDLLDTHIGMILLYTLTVLPIVVWIMRDQFNAVPIELEEAALVDGASVWVSFFKIVLPIVLPGLASAFILCLILCWNEYFLAALITSTDAKTMPVMVASQISSQSIKWWNMAAISAALCLPLIIAAIFLEKYIVKGMAAGAVKG